MLTHHPEKLKFHGSSDRHFFPGFASLCRAPCWNCQVAGAHSHKSARWRARADMPRLDPALLRHVSIPVLKDSAFLDGCEADCAGEDGETRQISASRSVFSGCVFNRLCPCFLFVILKLTAAALEMLSAHDRKQSKKIKERSQ